jgi:hypothetical protein
MQEVCPKIVEGNIELKVEFTIVNFQNPHNTPHKQKLVSKTLKTLTSAKNNH